VENEPVVINSGPLILLDRIDSLNILDRLPYRFIYPPAVRMELDAGIRLGRRIIASNRLILKELSFPVSPMIRQFLDPGEAEAIQLALNNRIARVCLDDLRGRKIAESVGLKVMGLLALLGKAKTLGLIPRLKPMTDKLTAEGAWYSKRIIQAVLAEVGE
jgi:predicted nucleic acid-binding protein